MQLPIKPSREAHYPSRLSLNSAGVWTAANHWTPGASAGSSAPEILERTKPDPNRASTVSFNLSNLTQAATEIPAKFKDEATNPLFSNKNLKPVDPISTMDATPEFGTLHRSHAWFKKQLRDFIPNESKKTAEPTTPAPSVQEGHSRMKSSSLTQESKLPEASRSDNKQTVGTTESKKTSSEKESTSEESLSSDENDDIPQGYATMRMKSGSTGGKFDLKNSPRANASSKDLPGAPKEANLLAKNARERKSSRKSSQFPEVVEKSNQQQAEGTRNKQPVSDVSQTSKTKTSAAPSVIGKPLEVKMPKSSFREPLKESAGEHAKNTGLHEPPQRDSSHQPKSTLKRYPACDLPKPHQSHESLKQVAHEQVPKSVAAASTAVIDQAPSVTTATTDGPTSAGTAVPVTAPTTEVPFTSSIPTAIAGTVTHSTSFLEKRVEELAQVVQQQSQTLDKYRVLLRDLSVKQVDANKRMSSWEVLHDEHSCQLSEYSKQQKMTSDHITKLEEKARKFEDTAKMQDTHQKDQDTRQKEFDSRFNNHLKNSLEFKVQVELQYHSATKIYEATIQQLKTDFKSLNSEVLQLKTEDKKDTDRKFEQLEKDIKSLEHLRNEKEVRDDRVQRMQKDIENLKSENKTLREDHFQQLDYRFNKHLKESVEFKVQVELQYYTATKIYEATIQRYKTDFRDYKVELERKEMWLNNEVYQLKVENKKITDSKIEQLEKDIKNLVNGNTSRDNIISRVETNLLSYIDTNNKGIRKSIKRLRSEVEAIEESEKRNGTSISLLQDKTEILRTENQKIKDDYDHAECLRRKANEEIKREQPEEIKGEQSTENKREQPEENTEALIDEDVSDDEIKPKGHLAPKKVMDILESMVPETMRDLIDAKFSKDYLSLNPRGKLSNALKQPTHKKLMFHIACQAEYNELCEDFRYRIKTVERYVWDFVSKDITYLFPQLTSEDVLDSTLDIKYMLFELLHHLPKAEEMRHPEFKSGREKSYSEQFRIDVNGKFREHIIAEFGNSHEGLLIGKFMVDHEIKEKTVLELGQDSN